MPVLHLGVIDQLYAQPTPKGAKSNSPPASTGDVAEWLEKKYGVMQAFYTAHGQDVADALTNSVTDALESLLMGAPANLDAFGPGTSQIQDLFKAFLDSKEIEGMGIAGVPTGAALKGVNHRMKDGKGTPGRASFVDSGLFQSSFKAWVD